LFFNFFVYCILIDVKSLLAMRFLISAFLCLFIFHNGFSQNNTLNKAGKWMNKARESLLQHKDDKAEKYFLRCIRSAPQYTDAYAALGNFYEQHEEYEKAADIFSRAAGACSTCRDAFTLPLVNSLWRAGQYEKASQALNSWQAGRTLPQASQQKIERLKRNLQFSKAALHADPTAEPVNLGPRVNSQFDEYFPSAGQNDSSLVFTRKTNGVDEDFYRARRDSCGGWFEAAVLGTPPNSSQQEGAQMISADGHYLFFMRCGNRSENGWEAGGCDLYFSYTQGVAWAQPERFGATINTPDFEGMPSLSGDNKTLYFVSDRAGGFGGKDIWVTSFKDGLWQVPQNLGPEINTSADETAPWIAPDNTTLYFTSDGHPGFGGQDIFYSKKLGAGDWSKPENLGFPLNSAYDDVSFCLSADAGKAYFASNRPGGAGGMDLYEVPLDSVSQPDPFTFLYGIVRDSLTHKRLMYAQIKLSDPNTGALLYHFRTNSGDASYLEALALNKKLALHVYFVGYLDYYDTLTFTRRFIYPPDTLNFVLLPDYYQPPLRDSLVFRHFFSKNDASFDDSTIAIIKRLVQPFIGKPHVEYIVNGFTDNSGTPSVNEDVSYSRARLIGTILFNLGIEEDKIHIQGWADASPLRPNDTEENRKMNRRVELVVRLPEK
jgi:tetratricopeptide (TPR) repeat protein